MFNFTVIDGLLLSLIQLLLAIVLIQVDIAFKKKIFAAITLLRFHIICFYQINHKYQKTPKQLIICILTNSLEIDFKIIYQSNTNNYEKKRLLQPQST